MSSSLDDVAAALRNDPLYVDLDAAAELEFDGSAQSAAREQLRGSGTPIRVAVLPRDSDITGADLAAKVDQSGTYVVVLAPNGMVNGASDVIRDANDVVISVADNAADMSSFVDGLVSRVNDLAAGGGGSDSGNDSASSGDGGGGGLLPLAILVAAGGGGFLLYRRNKRSKERAQLEQVRGALDEDITMYGERLSELDLDLRQDSKVPIEARNEYSRALDLYENAKVYAERAERPGDMKPVTNALEEGRWLLATVDARMKGEPLPDRRLPCFFDPGHGPSAEDIEWAPPGGVPRTVPACAADALRIKNGADPAIRMVPVGEGERRPYYDAGPAYGGWAGGYFGGLLPGMLMGTMLGSAMSTPVYVDGGGDGGWGGDSGGGDWGGGFDGGGDW
ncbi:hypothetical protein E1262_00005, partial [Jiangella aurantiaca]